MPNIKDNKKRKKSNTTFLLYCDENMQNHAGADRSVLMLLVVLPTIVVNGTDLYTGSEGLNKLAKAEKIILDDSEEIVKHFTTQINRAKG